MAYQFRLTHRSLSGAIKRQSITDFRWLQYSKQARAVGSLSFGLNGDHPALEALEDFDQFEVWWRNVELGVDWHMDFIGIYREPDWRDDEEDQSLFETVCLGDKSILGWRQIAWKSGIEGRSKFTDVPAETAMKTLVTYNCTTAASVANGRLREGDLATSMGITIQVAPDNGDGNLITRAFANGNLGRVLHETLMPSAGGDFSLTRIAPAVWEFQFHPGQLGQNKSVGEDKVVFSKSRGNMINVRYFIRRATSATVAIVGGQNEGEDRSYQVAYSDDHAFGNDLEMFIDARNETDEGLIQAGWAALYNDRAVKDLSFDVRQTPTTFYGPPVAGKRTYQVGDLVAAEHRDQELVRMVTGVHVSVNVPDSDVPVVIKVATEDV
jgi:hypothetical protein